MEQSGPENRMSGSGAERSGAERIGSGRSREQAKSAAHNRLKPNNID